MIDLNEHSRYRFQVQGMKCQGCVREIEQVLQQKASVVDSRVTLDPPELIFAIETEDPKREQEILEYVLQSMPNKFKFVEELDAEATAANASGLIQIGAPAGGEMEGGKTAEETLPQKSLQTYWPLILVFSYILFGTLVAMAASSNWNYAFGMRIFMGLFFVAFSFFKLLDLRGFADAYVSYDWVAQRIPGYGLVYPLIELSLGAAYLLGLFPLWTNWITLIVMSVSIGGVIESVCRRRTIRCACLGTGFNLPMSQVTIIEDGMMILMAAAMIWHYSS